MDKLNEIMAYKRLEIADRVREVQDSELEAFIDPDRPSLFQALFGHDKVSVISEIKRKSPSAGDIAAGASALAQGGHYVDAQTDAISVLTDERFFSGSINDLQDVTNLIKGSQARVPCLRKDFFVHPIQIVEAAQAGASAILIIVRALTDKEIQMLYRSANAAGLDSIFEIHNEDDLARAVQAEARIIGVNNRNLATFTTDLALSEALIPKIPEGCVSIAESGIVSIEDVKRVKAAGAQAVLIGQALMEHADPGAFIREIHNL
ncbi:MAG: indole-3-glycerol phosphate synthase TrpC [Verrucomicrobia bacterium]|nr:indole-3-glycerol phosphate synthase TrpC [Verrucomicrobiota bacterium]MDA1066099.1 indole-3-glycerol phosphate synthase TrpC [Verrucomicrobiota bacterium]